MNEIYARLAERIHDEIDILDQIVGRILCSWDRVAHEPGEQAYVDSVALNLHGFYSGVETLFELIARNVDEHLPTGPTWHRDLLHQMAREQEAARPAVIAGATVSKLDELRRFRHVVRNVYTMHLAPERIRPLTRELPTLWAKLRRELLAFADFLEVLAANAARENDAWDTNPHRCAK